MMMYMWGRQLGAALGRGEAPPAIRDRKFWEGTVLGVAVGARSFPGIIAVHADANSVLNFRREIGVQRQVEELGRQPGIESVALLDQDLTVLAHSTPDRVGQREADEALRSALEHRRAARADGSARCGGGRVYEVVKPLALEGARHRAAPDRAVDGLHGPGLEARSARRRRSRPRRSSGLGVLGMSVIFYTQHRHLSEVKALEAEMERGERLATRREHRPRRWPTRSAIRSTRSRWASSASGWSSSRPRARSTCAWWTWSRARSGASTRSWRNSSRWPGRCPSSPSRISWRRSSTRSAGLVEPEARRAGIAIDARRSRLVSRTLQADRDRIKQVLLNLVLNAIQAMPSGGTLELGAAAPGADADRHGGGYRERHRRRSCCRRCSSRT